MRASGEPAAHAHVESDLPRFGVASGGRPDVVDLRVRAPVAATGDSDLELARQIGVVRVAVQKAVDRERERRRIYYLVRVDAGKRASRNGAGVVPAGPHASPA